MDRIQAERLYLFPLKPPHLPMRLSSPHQLEKLLNLKFAERKLPPPLKEAYRQKIDLIRDNPEDFPLLTYWQFVLAREDLVIGEAGFKNLPDYRGEVEIGFGLAKGYRGHGYAREGVAALANWAFGRGDIRAILATTAGENIPSQKVLRAVGWEQTGEDEGNFFWRLESPKK